MAPPVAKDQELELTIDSLAYGGNGVARLNGFVVFVRRGLPGDTVRARVTKVKRNHAEALATEILEPGPRASKRRARTTRMRRVPLPGSRVRGAARAKADQVADALRRLGGLADPPLEPIVPAASVFHYRNKLEYSFTQDDGRPDARLPQGRPLGRGARDRACWLTTDLGNAIRNAVRGWAREEGPEAYDQETHAATCGTSSSARGATPARCSCSS